MQSNPCSGRLQGHEDSINVAPKRALLGNLQYEICETFSTALVALGIAFP